MATINDINHEIERIKTNIENAYNSLENKGVIVLANRNSANLAGSINSIPSTGHIEVGGDTTNLKFSLDEPFGYYNIWIQTEQRPENVNISSEEFLDSDEDTLFLRYQEEFVAGKNLSLNLAEKYNILLNIRDVKYKDFNCYYGDPINRWYVNYKTGERYGAKINWALGNGVTIPNQETVARYGDNFTFSASLLQGYEIVEVIANGNILTPINGSYIIPNVEVNQNIVVRSSAINYTITFEDADVEPITYSIEKAGVLPTPTKSGVDFLYWTDSEGNQYIDSYPAGIGNVVLTANWQSSIMILGVSGLYQSEPTLTRTDNAVGMDYMINSSTGEIVSDFSYVFPYNQMRRETIGSQTWVQIPSMWFRITWDREKRITDIAVSNKKGEVRTNIPEGSTEKWYQTKAFKYGAYGGNYISTGYGYTASGKTRSTGGLSITSLRNGGRSTTTNNNTNARHLIDIYAVTILRFLWLIEFANKNSQSVMTGALSNVQTGGTDNLGFSTGFNPNTKQMIWHNIEDFVSNLPEFIDGLYYTSTAIYAYPNRTNVSYYGTTTGSQKINYQYSTSTEGAISAFGWDDLNPFTVLPIECSSDTTYNTYFCDRSYYSSTAKSLNFGGSTQSQHGLFSCYLGADSVYSCGFRVMSEE